MVNIKNKDFFGSYNPGLPISNIFTSDKFCNAGGWGKNKHNES